MRPATLVAIFLETGKIIFRLFSTRNEHRTLSASWLNIVVFSVHPVCGNFDYWLLLAVCRTDLAMLVLVYVYYYGRIYILIMKDLKKDRMI